MTGEENRKRVVRAVAGAGGWPGTRAGLRVTAGRPLWCPPGKLASGPDVRPAAAAVVP